MASATQDQVRRAIERSNATGTAAEVLATITALSIPKSTGEQLWSFGGFAEVLGFELVSAFDAKLQELGYEWVRLLLGSGKVQPAGDLFQGQVTALVEAGHLAPEHGELLKRVGRWQESPLEHHNATRGLTTDEQTVQAVLDEVASEQSQLSLRRKIADGYNAVVAKVDIAEITTVEDALAMFTQLINAE